MSECNVDLLEKNLNGNNIQLLKFSNKAEVLAHLQSVLSKDMQIGWGGSLTLKEIGILDYLRNEQFPNLLDRDKAKLQDIQDNNGESPKFPEIAFTPKANEIERKVFFSDVFLTSSNAITEDGLIVNVDGHGNRVSAMIFGPKKVYFIIGKNKLVKNYQAAINRIKTVAAQLTRRINLDTPCAKTGVCQNCFAKQRICNYTVTIKRDYDPNRMHVLLVDENLGL
jgi:hypothetical protein